MKWNNAQALAEGWDIFQTDHDGEPVKLEILKLDDPASIPELGYTEPKFNSDEDAVGWVRMRAKWSEYHAHALKMHGKRVRMPKKRR